MDDLPVELQFRYKIMCDTVDSVQDLEELKRSYKEVVLDFLKHQEATKQVILNFSQGIALPPNKTV